jgi:branched-chain amino acid transport system ATP-binding protein
MTMTDFILTVDRLNVSYGGIDAVRDVSLRIVVGEVVAIVGPNGAGKSSTLNAIVGLIQSSGAITFDGNRIDGKPTEAIVRGGLTLCPEGRRVFSQLTVAENLVAGGIALPAKGEREANLARIYELFPVLAERRSQPAGTLSGGEQQMLAIGRAIMSNPRVLLLDEPSLGLAPQIVEKMFDLVGRLRDIGYTIVLVEQNVESALEVSDHGYVLVNGSTQMAGPATSLLSDYDVRQAYFGVG